MRILHLSPRYLPALGGAEIHLATISEALAARGHQVTIATSNAFDINYFWRPDAASLSLQEETINGVQIMRFPIRHLPLAPLSYRGWRRGLWLLSRFNAPVALLHRLARLTPAIPELHRWLSGQAGRFDLIGAMNIAYEPFLEAGRRLAARVGIPFVVYPLTHLGAGIAPGSDTLSGFYTMRHQVDTILNAGLLIAQTPTEKTFYVEAGLSPPKAIIVGPGIWPDDITGGIAGRAREELSLRGPIILSLGTQSIDKGTRQLLGAFAMLQAAQPGLNLVLAGPISDDIKTDLDTKTGPSVHCLGPVSEKMKRDLLAAADIFVMTSRVDSFGVVYLEAWAYGKPVVAARSWGTVDLIEDRHNGRLVPFADPEALAAALAELLARPEERERIGENGRLTMKHHTWPAKLERIATVYAEMAAG